MRIETSKIVLKYGSALERRSIWSYSVFIRLIKTSSDTQDTNVTATHEYMLDYTAGSGHSATYDVCTYTQHLGTWCSLRPQDGRSLDQQT